MEPAPVGAPVPCARARPGVGRRLAARAVGVRLLGEKVAVRIPCIERGKRLLPAKLVLVHLKGLVHSVIEAVRELEVRVLLAGHVPVGVVYSYANGGLCAEFSIAANGISIERLRFVLKQIVNQVYSIKALQATDIMGTSGCVKIALPAAALKPGLFCLGANIGAAAE